MQIEQSQQSKHKSASEKQPHKDITKTHNDNPHQSTCQAQMNPNNNNRNSYQGRPSNESFMSFGRMSIEQPSFHENQKISLESNISGKAKEIYEQKDLFQNLADYQRSSFHHQLFVRDEGSYKQYEIEHKVTQVTHNHQVHYPLFNTNNTNNFGLGKEVYNHLSTPDNFNLSSQEFKQRSSEGTNSAPYSALHHTPHNQSQSTIKMKIPDNQPSTNNNKNPNPKLQLTQNQILKQPEQKTISCKCPRSKCLLMYCECFSKGIMCNPTCSCYQCRNNPDFQQKRQNARRIVLERDPHAFSNKLEVVGGEQSSELAYKRGCNCKKTNCFKKYCQCFYAGVKCTYLCKCENCMNGGENAYKG